MANKRDTAAQKRAQKNRAARAALEARTTAAATPRPARTAAAVTAATAKKSKRSARATTDTDQTGDEAAPRGGLVNGRLGETPVDVETLEGSFLRKVVHVPGGMQVLMSASLVVVLTIMTAVVHTIPPEGAPPDAAGTRTIFDVYGIKALLILAPPVMVVGNALLFALSPKRRRMWTISAVLMAAFSLFSIQFLFPAGFLAYAVMRSRRVEDGPRRPRRPRRGASDADADAEAAGDDAGDGSGGAEDDA